MIRILLASLILLCLPGCGKESVQPAPSIFSDPGLDHVIAQYQAEHPELKKPSKDSLPKSNHPRQPIQQEKLQQIQPSMTAKEVIELLGNPMISSSQTFEGITTQIMFYCLISPGQLNERKIRLGSGPPEVETCSAPIVTENGIVVGLGWEFFREYTKSHSNLWDQELEKYYAIFCSSWEKPPP